MVLLQSTPTPLPGDGGIGWALIPIAGLVLIVFLLLPFIIGIAVVARRRAGIATWKCFLGLLLAIPLGYVAYQALLGEPGEAELETVVIALGVLIVAIVIPAGEATVVTARVHGRSVRDVSLFGMVGLFGGAIGVLVVSFMLGSLANGGGDLPVLGGLLAILGGEVVGTTLLALLAYHIRTKRWPARLSL